MCLPRGVHLCRRSSLRSMSEDLEIRCVIQPPNCARVTSFCCPRNETLSARSPLAKELRRGKSGQISRTNFSLETRFLVDVWLILSHRNRKNLGVCVLACGGRDKKNINPFCCLYKALNIFRRFFIFREYFEKNARRKEVLEKRKIKYILFPTLWRARNNIWCSKLICNLS